MSEIKITNLTFGYEGSFDNVFENVSFQMDTDWKLGFVGRNGRGKTTFLRLLMGGLEYQGSISASVGFDYFPLPMGDESKDTLQLIEEVFPDYELWMVCRELSLLDVDAEVLYRPYSTLSNGERTKVMLAVLFSRENNFLLIDEPTNHLDTHGRAKVGEYLNGKKGFILVSHDRSFLDSCIDHVLSINRADIEVQQGNFSSWQRNREYQDQFELAENEKRRKEIRHLTESAQRTAAWSDTIERGKIGSHSYDRGHIGHMAAKMMSKSKNTLKRREKAVEDKSKLLKNIETAEALKIHPATHHSKTLVTATGLSLHYGEKDVCSGISFKVEQGQRIALTGKNGSGKSSILKLIIGEDIEHGGDLALASKLVISYVPQDTSGLAGNLRQYAADNGIDESLFMAILRKLDFSRDQFEKPLQDYSMGQRKKVLIARSLCESAHLFIWDEPLNYIDVISRMQIERLLLEHQPTMLFVEHDSEFCRNVGSGVVSCDSRQ